MYKKLLTPKRILVCGLKNSRSNNLRKIITNVKRNFKGELLLVEPDKKPNSKSNSFISVGQILDEIDLALIALPVSRLLPTLRECGVQDVKCAVIFNTSQRNQHISHQLKQKITAIGSQYGMHILGPRSGGFIDTDTKLNASIFPFPDKGNLGLISQSTRRTEAILKWSKKENFGFSKVYNLGEKAGLTENELLLHLDEDSKTEIILICLENITDKKNLLRLIKLISPRKKIIIVPTGSNEGNNLASSNDYQDLAAQGAITTHSLPEFFTITKVIEQSQQKKTFLQRIGLS